MITNHVVDSLTLLKAIEYLDIYRSMKASQSTNNYLSPSDDEHLLTLTIRNIRAALKNQGVAQ